MKISISTFLYDKITVFFLELGPRAGSGSRTFELAGTGGHGPLFSKITGRHGQRAAKCLGLLTSTSNPEIKNVKKGIYLHFVFKALNSNYKSRMQLYALT
jgi:hypothetical protein